MIDGRRVARSRPIIERILATSEATTGDFMAYIFISYSSKDRVLVSERADDSD